MNPGADLEGRQSDYEKYQSLGVFLSEADFANVLALVKEETSVDPNSLRQAESRAKAAGITLESRGNGIDPRAALYGALHYLLRAAPGQDIKKYSRRLDDQSLFAEALRIQGDTGSLAKFSEMHPGI